jgi:Domain of unknown function (DUF4184)
VRTVGHVPFTGSHPAAVLPLLGIGLPASALVIGSMSPDLPYYLPLTTTSWPTHSLLGIVTIDVVLGLAAWALWHGLLSAPALAESPVGLRQRLAGRVELGLAGRAGLRQLGLVVVALVVGSATHVLWDEFSHPGRWGTHHLHVLARDWGGLPGYRWVQYGSGLFGVAVEAYWLWRWWQRTPAREVPSAANVRRTWLVLLLVGAVAGCFAAATSHSIQRAAFNGATNGAAAIAAVGILLAVGWHLRRSRLRPG